MQRTKYLLMVDGKPAYFIGGQICYARSRYRGGGIKESQLVNSPREARRLIKKSLDYRAGMGWNRSELDYSYIPIRLGA